MEYEEVTLVNENIYAETIRELRELRESLGYEDEVFQPRGHWDRKLMVNLVELSESNNYNDARLEWEATGRVFKRSRDSEVNRAWAEEWGHEVGHCICGHSVVYHYEVRNTFNENITVLGSDHIENFHIARHIIQRDGVRAITVTADTIKKWRKQTENDMNFKEWKFGDKATKFFDDLEKVRQMDMRFNYPHFSIDFTKSLKNRIEDLICSGDFKTLVNFDAVFSEKLEDNFEYVNIDFSGSYIEISSPYKKTPRHLSSDSYITRSSVLYRSNKAIDAGKKPPASVMNDLIEMKSFLPVFYRLRNLEFQAVEKMLRATWSFQILRSAMSRFEHACNNLEVNRAYKESSITTSKNRIAELEQLSNGFTIDDMISQLTEEQKSILFDVGIMPKLDIIPKDFKFYLSSSVLEKAKGSTSNWTYEFNLAHNYDYFMQIVKHYQEECDNTDGTSKKLKSYQEEIELLRTIIAKDEEYLETFENNKDRCKPFLDYLKGSEYEDSKRHYLTNKITQVRHDRKLPIPPYTNQVIAEDWLDYSAVFNAEEAKYLVLNEPHMGRYSYRRFVEQLMAYPYHQLRTFGSLKEENNIGFESIPDNADVLEEAFAFIKNGSVEGLNTEQNNKEMS